MDRDQGPIDRLFGDGDGDGDGDEEGDEDEWRFSVAEVGPDADEAGSDADPDAAGPDRAPLEPESVTPEHAAFVIAGAVLTLVVVLSAL